MNTRLRASVRKHIRENIISFAFSSLFGVVVTVVVFLLTSPPRTPIEIRENLLVQTRQQISREESIPSGKLHVQNALRFSAQTDIGLADTAVMFGAWDYGKNDDNNQPYHYVAIFDLAAEGVLDRLAGRQSSYKLSSLTLIYDAPELDVSSFEAVDIDKDGSKELHLRLCAGWADSISVTPLIYKRGATTGWDLMHLPSIEKTVSEIVEGKHPNAKYPALSRPIRAFGSASDKSTSNKVDISHLFPITLYQDDIPAKHNGQKMTLCFLRNGGDYQFRTHPVRAHFQVAVIGQINDEAGVISNHHLVVMFMALQDGRLVPDVLWNWGYPMFSICPTKRVDVHLDDIAKGGISAHVEGNTFFGYTDFQRLEVGGDAEAPPVSGNSKNTSSETVKKSRTSKSGK